MKVSQSNSSARVPSAERLPVPPREVWQLAPLRDKNIVLNAVLGLVDAVHHDGLRSTAQVTASEEWKYLELLVANLAVRVER